MGMFLFPHMALVFPHRVKFKTYNQGYADKYHPKASCKSNSHWFFQIEKHDEENEKYVKMGEKNAEFIIGGSSHPTYSVAKNLSFPFLLQYILLTSLCFRS